MWWLMIIPIATILILYFVFPERITWWEYVIPVVSSIITISIANGICDYAMSSDEEYHGGWVSKTVWDEHWTETYTETETYTDSEGHAQTRLVTKTRYHPDEYKVVDSNNYDVSINYNHFNDIESTFGNIKTENPWRSGQSSWGDGRRFTSEWPGTETTFIPCFTSHRYSNRVARSHSIFNFKEVSKKDKQKYKLYEYPKIYRYHYQNSILGWNDPSAEWKLTVANAKLGARKQVRIFILVFFGQPLEAALKQQNYWKNGNKNEVVICIGTNGKKIEWVYPFAWDNERLKVDLREEIASQDTFNINNVVDTAVLLVQSNFNRKHFKEFDYIKLDPPGWAVFIALLFICSINGFITYIVINNEQNPEYI